MPHSVNRPIASLWELEWEQSRLSCRIYRSPRSLELRLESPTATILCEPFTMEPRALARARALRDSLKRRGWKEGRRRRPSRRAHRREPVET